jgi:hypothetical protein
MHRFWLFAVLQTAVHYQCCCSQGRKAAPSSIFFVAANSRQALRIVCVLLKIAVKWSDQIRDVVRISCH